MTLSLIETIKTSIYSTETTHNTKMRVKILEPSNKKYIRKKKMEISVLCWLFKHYLYVMLRVTQPK